MVGKTNIDPILYPDLSTYYFILTSNYTIAKILQNNVCGLKEAYLFWSSHKDRLKSVRVFYCYNDLHFFEAGGAREAVGTKILQVFSFTILYCKLCRRHKNPYLLKQNLKEI